MFANGGKRGGKKWKLQEMVGSGEKMLSIYHR